MHNPEPNEIYKHFKGNLYKIVTLAEHAETGDKIVVYQALYGDYRVYARELSSFLGSVDKKKYPGAEQECRFEPVEQIVGQAGLAEQERQEGPEKQAGMQACSAAADDATEAGLDEDKVPDADTVRQLQIDPLVLEFLESDTYEDKLNILVALHSRITDDMINTLAAAMDVEIGEGSLEERFAQLKTCIVTLERYECSRLR